MTATVNITHRQGNSRKMYFGPVKDASGNSIDLTNAVNARWWMAKKVGSEGADIFIQKELGDGVELTNDGGDWTVVVTLVPNDTEEVPPASYYHECEVIDSTERVATVVSGKFVLKDTIIPSQLDVEGDQ